MQPQDFPSINLGSALTRLGEATYHRGLAYARDGRVLNCLWDAQRQTLAGSVWGSQGRAYATTVHLSPDGTGSWKVAFGFCSCPVHLDCKHVAAIAIAIADATTTSAQRAQNPTAWRHSLDALLPATPPQGRTGTPLAIELNLATNGSLPLLVARLMRPAKRGGWVADHLRWDKVRTLGRDGYLDAHVQVLREFYVTYRASISNPYGVYHYSYGQEDDGRIISLLRFGSPQLWPLLEGAREAGVKLIQAGTHREVRPPSDAELCLDVTADESGDLAIEPMLRVNGTTVRPLAFIGSPGHGVVYDDAGTRLARLDKPAPEALQRMALGDAPVVIPASEAARFAAEYYPRLRHTATITSSDDSFTPPEIVGPTLVLRADYQDGHELEVSWEWAYRLGDRDFRTPIGSPDHVGYRDPEAETALASTLEAPLEQVRLRGANGRLVPRVRLSGLDTMRFATEIQPLLAELPEVDLEVTGDAADYREATLAVAVTTDTVPGQTDWFDLGVTISIEGKQIPFVSVFTALASGQSHLLLPDGAYFSLDKPELVKLRELITEAGSLTDAEDGPPRISRFQVGLFDELAELGVVTRQADEWRRQADGLRALNGVAPAAVPSDLRVDLRPYQSEGFSWLTTLYAHGLGGILADDMGLGKTIQSLALICHVRQQNPGMAPFLVVAPASVVANWATEAARFAPELNVVPITDTLRRARTDLDELTTGAHIVVTSYTLFRLDFEAHANRTWSGLILDEAQFVKNHRAKTYQCARKLATPFKLAITGTPMENNLMEFWALLSITAPGLFPSPTKFNDFFAKPIEKNRDAELLALFHRRIKPLVKRRTKEHVAAELPAKQEQVLEIDLPSRHRALYDKRLQRERQKVLGLLNDMQRNRVTILRSLTVLRQMALHPGLVDPEYDQMASAKIDALAEHLRDVVAGGHRALVFSQFTRFLGRVRDRLDSEGIDYCYLDGQTRNRASVIQRFKDGDAPVFLISLKAGGFGLNLTEADYCFLLDPWWNPATEAQAIDRTHRIGQTRNVMVYRLIARDTIEDKVLALNARKAKLFASVVDDGNAFGSNLTADDIRGLVA
ncbi:DEAD/DEAH box helicase [Mycobacterium bourgelatii]|uniref:DNA helicase n=1 Tax=Mycobacterium bourgelatii TaxID=1273442 RepID=A0A7I9YRY4_MYCBU|nr:DEAD/DEAH box helicase [Mycobacterium bourgelatii]MCV6974494.1 DEAD/DEAH box helicase [Mycobacterium bourgelatii]GFG91450.1 DNA helicase [Mycobacterium bourgelatii]